MKAIIIEDHDSKTLLDKLKLEKFQEQMVARPVGIDKVEWDHMIDTIHRKFHFIVCKWLQEQGCSVL